MDSHKTHAQTTIGHVHLTVADLDRALAFYRGLLGFEVMQYYGDSAVFLSAGGYHHHLGLNTWAGTEAEPPPQGHTGLYHFAIRYPERRELARIVKRLLDADYTLDGAADHGVSEAIYLRDPDQNGVELTCDRPRENWPRTTTGELTMVTETLDMAGLLAEIE